MCFYLRNWQVTFLLYTLGVFISEYTAKAFTEPRDYRVVFLIQKKTTPFQTLPSLIPFGKYSLLIYISFTYTFKTTYKESFSSYPYGYRL